MRHDERFYDHETGEIISATQLYREFVALKNEDPDTYDYSFSEYIENCLSATLSRF